MFRRTFLAAIALSASTLVSGTAFEATPKKSAVTEIRIHKNDHRLELMTGTDVFRSYKVAIGCGGPAHRRFEAEAEPPVGTSRVPGRIKALFHEFLVVSYPNAADVRRFGELKQKGEVPAGRGVGFGIGIHGVGNPAFEKEHKSSDWTLGCVALDDAEIDEVASLVPDGTRIVIED